MSKRRKSSRKASRRSTRPARRAPRRPRRSEQTTLRQLRDLFGLTGREADAALDALTDEGYNPNVNTLGPNSEWIIEGRVFDALDEAESVRSIFEEAAYTLPEAEEYDRLSYIGDLPEIYEDHEPPDDVLEPGEYEVTFSYEEHR